MPVVATENFLLAVMVLSIVANNAILELILPLELFTLPFAAPTADSPFAVMVFLMLVRNAILQFLLPILPILLFALAIASASVEMVFLTMVNSVTMVQLPTLGARILADPTAEIPFVVMVSEMMENFAMKVTALHSPTLADLTVHFPLAVTVLLTPCSEKSVTMALRTEMMFPAV